MKRDSSESIVLRDCPPEVAQELAVAGGLNRFGEPNFRVVWGYNRIVPMTGEWQEWEHSVAKLTDKLTGFSEQRPFIRLVRSVVETRQEPKYLPANCWHLEKWCPPEDYGSPDLWRKQGEEVVQGSPSTPPVSSPRAANTSWSCPSPRTSRAWESLCRSKESLLRSW
jgi:hypothetical protein